MTHNTRKRPRILHLHSSFSLGGKEARAVRLMNHFGQAAEHVILSADPDAMSARDAIEPQVRVSFPTDAPSLQGKPGIARYVKIARYMQQFDLILSYNWGSMDGAMAHTLFAKSYGLPPLIHHEDGFNEDEFVKLKAKRNWFRIIGLAKAYALVVPSTTLEAIALKVWQQPRSRVHRIANGIRTSSYAYAPSPKALTGVQKAQGDLWIGTLAGLRAIKNLPRLVRACAGLPPHVKLVIVGEGPERDAIMAEATRLGMADRVIMPGFRKEPWRFVGLFDVFALSSDSEQAPISVLEAMAASLPVAAPRIGDVANMVSADNAALLPAAGDEAGLQALIARLVEDAELRAALGTANRTRAKADFEEKAMLSAYGALYGAALGDAEFQQRFS